MTAKLAASTAIALILTLGHGQAQEQQQQPVQQQAQGGQQGSDQRLTQEAARYEGTEIYISPAGVRQIQQSLNQQGYDVGSVDGQWNQQTGQSAANFMQAQGLEPVTSLTVSLVHALGLGTLLSGEGQAGGQQAAGSQQENDQRLAQEQAAEGTPLHVSPAGVRVIKQALNQQGYDVGNVNGEWDQQTQQAAMNYQQAKGLEPVGVLDVSLIQSLGVGGQVYAGGQGGEPSDQRLAQEQAGQAGGEAAAGGTGQGTPLYISSAGVRELIQALNQQGYDAGSVDGQWSEETATAVANFQQANGLEPSGTLTTSFLAAIGLNDWLPTQGGGGQGGAQQTSQGGAQTGGQTITNETTGAVTGSPDGGQSGGAAIESEGEGGTVLTIPVE